VLNLVDPPLVQVRVGEPVTLKRVDPDQDTKKIMKAIMALLPPESRVKRTPTPEEIRLALPPGFEADRDNEDRRRPGTD
jgi:putative phosphoserine phosphatase/1-acylglycerol-3-phosphate O-acyltransferase